MEKMLTTIKGRVHQKATDQAGNTTNSAGLTARMAAQDTTKEPQDTEGETRKETRIESTKTKATANERSQNILTHRRRTCFTDLAAFTTCTRWQESFQSSDERLQDIPRTTRCHGIKLRSIERKHDAGQHNHRSWISSTK
jgi:hypothetical protein